MQLIETYSSENKSEKQGCYPPKIRHLSQSQSLLDPSNQSAMLLKKLYYSRIVKPIGSSKRTWPPYRIRSKRLKRSYIKNYY